MATEEVVKKRIEFFCSSLDAFFQDFIKHATADDRLGSIVAAARICQIASCISEEYQGIVENLAESPTELKAANQALDMVVDMVNRNGELLNGEPSVPALAGTPDRSLS